MKELKNYAIIGSGGFIAPRHIQAIKDTGGQVILTCDIDVFKKADFINYRDMLLSPIMKQVDVIVICSPNHLHAEMVRDCLRIGKIVLCEKPLTINTDFNFLDGVNVVQQLHFHSKFNEICHQLKRAKNVRAVLRAYRDENFWNSWKGDEQKSGGVVYILGSHIWDLLITALGEDFEVIEAQDSMKRSNGIVRIGNARIEYSFEFLDSRLGQTRHLEIEGKIYQLSTADNLSFEGLHDQVYVSLKQDKVSKLRDVLSSIMLMDTIKKKG